MVDVANAAISRHGWKISSNTEQQGPYEKWPVWARLVTIIGLSALLWGGIISAAIALFG